MLGRLPVRYRLTIWAAGLLTFACFGIWLSVTAAVPVVWPSAAAIGAFLGTLAVAAFLHVLEHAPR